MVIILVNHNFVVKEIQSVAIYLHVVVNTKSCISWINSVKKELCKAQFVLWLICLLFMRS